MNRRVALQLFDHQGSLALDLAGLRAVGQAALGAVLAAPGPQAQNLPELGEVEISFLDDAAIARVHGEFLGDAAPTDVITFAHGEILISAETAVRQAAEYGQAPDRELALYLIHGLLHLNGHEDESAAGFARMQELQEGILEAVWPR